MSKTTIITRHQPLVDWLAQKGITGDVIEHATPENVIGRHVIGALPMHLAALAEKISVVDLPGVSRGQRGNELSVDEMNAAGARLKTYVVRETTFG